MKNSFSGQCAKHYSRKIANMKEIRQGCSAATIREKTEHKHNGSFVEKKNYLQRKYKKESLCKLLPGGKLKQTQKNSLEIVCLEAKKNTA